MIVQTGLNDVRFDFCHFAKQPVWLIRQGIKNGQQKRNFDQLTLARCLQAFINSKIDNEKKSIDDESQLLPHPDIWKQSVARQLDISKETAQEILVSINYWLSPSLASLLDNHIDEIKAISNE